MQFDEFDKKVKAAADHHHPAYDEQAWTKMEKLLNKHLPQKDDDRRKFIFFFLFFIGLAGAGLLIGKPWKGNKSTDKSLATAAPVKEGAKPEKQISENNDDVNNSITINANKPAPELSVKKQPGILSVNTNKKTSNTNTTVASSPHPAIKNVQAAVIADKNQWKDQNRYIRNDAPDNLVIAPVLIESKTPVNNTIKTDLEKEAPLAVNDAPIKIATKPATNTAVTIADTKKENKPVTQNKAKKKNSNTKSNSAFFFTLSAGPDISFVGKDKLGTAKLLAGGGLGYTFNNQFSIRIGFYSGRKVYTASPGAYNPPSVFYSYYPYLEKVDADCKVYEIPIAFSYNFSKSSKQSIFASAGVSAYLMKSEKYKYFYKNYPTGPTLNRERIINNGNKHYFSTLTLSGGYQRNINKNIFFIVEPYVKLPLSGVGYGNVKLKSGGVLFSIGIKPFGTKKDRSATGR